MVELYLKRADAYSKLDNLDLAENDILHALDLNESDVDLLQKLLMIYAKQNRVDDAAKIIEKIKSIKEKQG